MLREWLGRALFFILFICLLIVVTVLYQWIQSMFSFGSPYDLPSGDAVKAFQGIELEANSIPDRLIWFLRYGE